VLEKEGAEHRLEERCEHVPVAGEALDLVLAEIDDAVLAEPVAEIELPGDDRATRARDDVRADLREPPFREVGVAGVELVRDRELEDAVAEELEALVRVRAVFGPRRMGERDGRPFGRQRVDQRRKRAVTGASRRSRRPGRQS
jgi:hypothetical protein